MVFQTTATAHRGIASYFNQHTVEQEGNEMSTEAAQLPYPDPSRLTIHSEGR